jgi:hypothetical protein
MVVALISLNSCKTRQEKGLKHYRKACAYYPDLCKQSIKDSIRIKDSLRITIKDSVKIIKAGQSGIDGIVPCDSTEKTFRGGAGNFTYVLKFFRDGRFTLDIKEIQDTKSEYKERDKESIKEKDKVKETITPPVIVEKPKTWFERFQSWTSWLWWLGLILIASIILYFILTFSVPFIRNLKPKK